MNKKLWSFSLLSIFSVVLISSFNQKSINAETPSFDENKCIKSFVSQKLTESQAQAWCDATKECLKQPVITNLPSAIAQDVCSCTIKKSSSLYSIEEFKNIAQKSDEKLRDIGEMCFEEMLFEE